MKNMIMITVLVGLMMVQAGCVTLSKHLSGKSKNPCVQLTPEAQQQWPEIRKIIVAEAKNAGFGTMTLETKPTKYNNMSVRMEFEHKRKNGDVETFIMIKDGDKMCFGGAGVEADPRNASGAIIERLQEQGK